MISVVFFGTPQFAVPSLLHLIENPAFNVLGVVTQPDRRRGRGKQLIPSAVKDVALEHHLPIWQPASVKKDREVLMQLRSQLADAFVVVAYGQILSAEILAMPRLGCINSHASLLPDYRGAAPIQWALHDGQSTTGLTTMQMDAGMDTGDILLKDTVDIEPLENAQDLAQRLASMSGELLAETLKKLDQQQLEPIPQNHGQATYARLIHKDDHRLDWAKSAMEIHNQVRGFFPSCIAHFREQPIKVLTTVPLTLWERLSAKPLPNLDESEHPGAIVHILKEEGPIVQTGAGLLLLKEVQLSGKKRQSGQDFANGVRLSVGEILQDG